MTVLPRISLSHPVLDGFGFCFCVLWRFFSIVVKTWIAGCDIRLFHSALFLASAHTFVRNYLLSSLDNDTMILLSLQPSDNKEQVTNGWFILKLSLPFYKNGYRKYFLVYDIDLCEHYITFKLLRSEKI